jgi:MFS family permease
MMSRLTSQPILGSEFRKLWAASAVSNLGDGIGLAAAPLLAAALTRDPALIAGLVFAQRLPWFLFSLVSGALVDRLDRRLVIGSANLFRAFLLGLLGAAVLIGWASLPLLYVVFFLLGSAETLIDNAALAILPAIIPRDRLEQANGRLFATETVANEFVGPPLGGLLFSLVAAIPFLANSGTFAVAALLALLLCGQFRARRPEGTLQRTLWADIHEGVRWFWNHRLLRTLGVMAGMINFFWAATTAIFVLVAQDILGLNDVGFGIVLASGAFGGVAGGLVADRFVRRLGAGWTIFATNLLPGLAYVAIALTSNPFIVGAMFALMSFAAMVGNVILISLRQTIIPNHLLGRVTSAYRLFALGALPIGALFGGSLAQTFGLTAPYWAGGATLTIMAFALLRVVNNRTVAAAREQLL